VDHMLLLFTSLESNCGVICSPFQKNPPKKSGHFIIILYSAKHDFFSVYEHVLRSYLFFIILFSSEFYRLVNTAIALDKREKKCQEIMCPVLCIAALHLPTHTIFSRFSPSLQDLQEALLRCFQAIPT